MNPRRLTWPILTVLALCGLVLSAAGADLAELEQRIKEHQRELGETKRELEDTRQQIERLTETEKTGLARLEALRAQIAAARRYINQLDVQLADRTEQVGQVARQVEETAKRIEARRQDLTERLTDIYKYGRLVPLEAVLATDQVDNVYRRLMHLRWVARADRRTAEELIRLRANQLEQQSRLIAARDDLVKLKAERLASESLLASSCRAESAMVAKVRTERDAKLKLERELDEAAQRLQALIADLEKERAQASAGGHFFEQNRGKLPWPVRGELITRFGPQTHPVYKTKTTSSGIDIRTSAGTPALAIASGKVAYADQFMGYGRLVILDHGGGFYTLYGNLEDILARPGAEIPAGSPVGRTRDFLHFEIRRQGQPTDPLLWLAP